MFQKQSDNLLIRFGGLGYSPGPIFVLKIWDI